jgi:hypothetical protein
MSNYTKVSDGSDTPSPLVFSKQEMLELSDYLQYAGENIREYADECAQRYPGLPMVGTLREYADRAEQYRRRMRALVP